MHSIRSRSRASLKQGEEGCLHDHKKCSLGVRASDTPVGPRRQRTADDEGGLVAAFGSQPWRFLSKSISIASEPTLRSNAAILAPYSEIVVAAASSTFSSPRSYWLSHN